MNKSMIIGLVVGIGIAATGAVVAGYAMRDDAPTTEISGVDPSADQVASAPAPDTSTASAAPAEECWDETVEHPVEPKDDKRIAGTAIGAVVGGVVGHQFGGGSGKTLATAAGAAAGAYGGRKAQEKYQDGKTYTTTERRCKPAQ
jgi:uncharacterized protein YcfJ